jgi:hypothetical protein
MGGKVCSSSLNALEHWKIRKVKEVWSCLYTFCPPAEEALRSPWLTYKSSAAK